LRHLAWAAANGLSAGDMKVRNAREDNPYGFTFEGGLQRVAEFGHELSDTILAAMVNPCGTITDSVDARLDETALPLMERRIEEIGDRTGRVMRFDPLK
jgi:hypothetical protein